MIRKRTQVGIVGAGPAGLLLGHLLHRDGIDSVIVENRSRDYIEHRVRAGVLEQGSVDLLVASGVGDRMREQGLIHHGIELRFGGKGHRIDLTRLSGGKSITVYGQQEVVKDLIHARLAAGGELRFQVESVRLQDVESGSPRILFHSQGEEVELRCDFIAGCDGFHGVCRESIPPGVLTVFERSYPFAWLGILAQAPPTREELIYACHERGFALYSMRSPQITRLYLQVAPDEDLGGWPDARIWEELHARLETDGAWSAREGPIMEKGVTGMRSFVVEPMQYGRLFLAGDAAHIVPPTGAKGMNLAIADVFVLAQALRQFFASGRSDRLDAYSQTCLRRVWRAEHFSWWMTSMLHLFPNDPFQQKLQRSQLDYVVGSRLAAASLAENYVGLPLDPGTRLGSRGG
ncbi:MAG TPA: 4-hydroxybenzoate 3-monooxygenase [Casimicrobiaceae bacterium]|nr:4-hydroxybenzoate 3-monooxygenase [Casimicrobiaceae bacterium]